MRHPYDTDRWSRHRPEAGRDGWGGRASGLPMQQEGRFSRGYDRGFQRNAGPRYGRDYWWIGEHALGPARYADDYDRAYRRFSERTHPRFSPVGGMYGPVGGRYLSGGMPRPLREETWFSDWTRWF